MAKWGEGDPRWIVEERADATNVNNWHWTEKNATAWSKDSLKSLLQGLKLEDEKYTCEIQELTKIEGEASANNRKAKLFFFYEWELKADWKGRVKTSDKSYKGTIEIPNLSEEHAPHDVDVNVSVTDDKSEAHELKEFVRTKGVHLIRERLGQYIDDLKEKFSQGMILPTKDNGESNPTCPTPENGIQGTTKPVLAPVSGKVSPSVLGVKIHCKNLTDTEEFKCSAADLYRVFTTREMVRAFTQGDAVIDATKGGRFQLFGGNVSGEFTELEPEKKLEMRWRNRSWPDEHYSKVSLTFVQKDDCTELRLFQTGIPAGEVDKTREGWKNHYWRSIKQTFGYGSMFL